MNKKIILLIDFDSTFVTVESLDILAEIVLQNRKDKDAVVKKIKEITALGMEGKITFPDSLRKRMELFRPTKNDVRKLIAVLQKNITPSVKNNSEFLKKNNQQIYILSSGFRDYMVPVVVPFGISEDHIFGNEFLFGKAGKFVGYDTTHLLAQEKGKVKMIKEKKLKGILYMVGDGHTDWEVKEAEIAKKFFVFTENIYRESVAQKADIIANNFTEVINNL